MRLIILTLLLLSSSLSWSNDISVGGVLLKIPSPEGFSAVTPQMAFLYEAQKHFVAPMNEEFVTFIPDDVVEMALNDDVPDLPRRFTVQTAKPLVGRTITSLDFATLKHTIKTQNHELLKQVEAQLPELVGKMNEGIKEQYDVDLALSVSQMVPMPVHEETDRTLSYSALVRYDMVDENGEPAPFVSVVTATLVHVKGKVLFLYSYAEESGLEWSRQASQQWANNVVSANPSDLQTTVKETIPSGVWNMNWEPMAAKVGLAAIIGLAVGLFAWLRTRKS